jgi:hypothetical protein
MTGPVYAYSPSRGRSPAPGPPAPRAPAAARAADVARTPGTRSAVYQLIGSQRGVTVGSRCQLGLPT